MNKLSDKKIIDSWAKNVKPWIKAVQDQQIESRKLVTDKAIVDAVIACERNSVLDIGCGEGWLAHELAALGHTVLGVDVIPELIQAAKQRNHAQFEVLAYEDISTTTITKRFDIAVCNFSLLGKESVDNLFKVIPSLLEKGGYFIVQTPHPKTSCGDLDYQDGWREGSWAGFSNAFCDPAPWYFRTLETWMQLFSNMPCQKVTVIEPTSPTSPTSGKPASLIMIGTL